jgi:proline iminopeptidase
MTEGEMIDVSGVATFVRRMGRGPTVVVVHGGPGFDHAYLEDSLRTLANRRTLLFYDQPGSGRSPVSQAVNAQLIFDHFASLVDGLPGALPLGIIAHSWGALVALGARARGMKRDVFEEGLLVTPVPVTRAKYDAASVNLFARFPPEVVGRYAELAQLGASREVVELLLPYYLARPVPAAEVGVNLDIATFTSVTNSLGAFDLRHEISLLRECAILTTDNDISPPELVSDLLGAARRRCEIRGVGHFPMHEARVDFQGVLSEAFR